MNKLIEQIKRDAVTIQKFTEAELQTRQSLKAALGPAYKEIETTHDAIDRIMTRNAQTEARIFNDTAKRLDSASTRIHELEEKLKTAETRIAKYAEDRALIDAWHSISLENGREPDELMGDYMVRIWKALDVAQRFADDQKEKLKDAQKRIEEKDSDIGKLISLSNERALEIGRLKEGHSAGSDGLLNLQIETLKRQLQTAKDDLERQHLREAKISAEYQSDIKKILATANKLGRADYESPESFMNRQAADMESQDRQLALVRQELGDKTQKVLELSRWHEENLEKIKVIEADLAQCRSQESPEATRNALRNVTADRDRIRAELASILAEANKSGRCNGDPVQLLKQGQADLDALTHFEKANAKLDALVSQLQGELAEARAGQQKAKTAETVSNKRFMDLMQQSDSCGRLAGESLESFIARLTNERGKAWNREIQASEKVARLERLSASEIARLSALVASLQVELEEAKRRYGDIMAALGNETPLDAVYRLLGWPIKEGTMQTPSTIPHDERAKLVWEIADLRKRLEKSQRAHAEVEHELRDARNGANECGMNSGEKLRAFIYRKRGELLDALHANDKIHLLANERGDKLRAALETVANQSAAIAEAQRVVDKYTGAAAAATKLKDWAFTVRHKVLVKIVHDKAMEDYDKIIKELDGEAKQ